MPRAPLRTDRPQLVRRPQSGMSAGPPVGAVLVSSRRWVLRAVFVVFPPGVSCLLAAASGSSFPGCGRVLAAFSPWGGVFPSAGGRRVFPPVRAAVGVPDRRENIRHFRRTAQYGGPWRETSAPDRAPEVSTRWVPGAGAASNADPGTGRLEAPWSAPSPVQRSTGRSGAGAGGSFSLIDQLFA